MQSVHVPTNSVPMNVPGRRTAAYQSVENVALLRQLARLFLLSLLLPLAVSLGAATGKPLDIIYADLLLPVTLAAFAISGARLGYSVALYLVVMALVVLASVVVSIGVNDSLLASALSAARLYKLTTYFAAGYLIARVVTPPELTRLLAGGSVAAVMILFVSDLTLTAGFPATRWGGRFFSWGTYGFPNTPAVFYIAYIFFATVFLSGRGKTRWAWPLVATVVVGAVMVVMTLSRSAMVCLAVFLALVALRSRIRPRYKVGAAAVLLAASAYVMSADIGVIDGLSAKFDRTFSSDDATSGRVAIWVTSLDLIADRPLLGYGFEPFSKFSAHFDTPHNQYLELAYKGGIALLLALLMPIVWFTAKAVRSSNPLEQLTGFLIIAVLVSSITQPNISYAPTGSLLFLLWGYCLASTRTRWHTLAHPEPV